MEIHNGGVYKAKVTPGILEKYFKKISTSPKEANRVSIRLVFLSTLKDFLRKRLKTDDFCYIAAQIYYEIKKPSWFDYDREFQKSLEDASEAAWYKWKQKEEYKRMLNHLKNYYRKNKTLLKVLES